MKNRFNKRNFISRVIMLPFFAIIILFVYIKTYISHMFNFIWYGGEVVVYSDDTNPKTILESVKKLENIIESNK